MAQGRGGKKRKRSRSAGYHRKNQATMLAITAVAALLCLVVLLQGRTLKVQIADGQQKLAMIEAEIEKEEARAQEIDELREYMQSSEYIEKAAKEKIGLLKKNEMIFKETE